MCLARWQQWPISTDDRQGGGFVFNYNNCSFSIAWGHSLGRGGWPTAIAALGQSVVALAVTSMVCMPLAVPSGEAGGRHSHRGCETALVSPRAEQQPQGWRKMVWG